MNLRSRDDGGDFLEEFEWLHDDVGGARPQRSNTAPHAAAVGVWFFKAIDDLAFVVNLETVERDGWASDIAAEFFELLSVRARDGNAGVERKS